LSPRSRATFAKRQKEQARQEKQRAKAQRRLEKKSENRSPGNEAEPQEPFSAEEEGETAPAHGLSFDASNIGILNPESTKEQS
jgi:hypothetical protein